MTYSDNLTSKVDELRQLVADADEPPTPDPQPKQFKPETPAFVLAALCVLGIVVLTILGDPIPEVLPVALMAAITGGAAITQSRTPLAP